MDAAILSNVSRDFIKQQPPITGRPGLYGNEMGLRLQSISFTKEFEVRLVTLSTKYYEKHFEEAWLPS